MKINRAIKVLKNLDLERNKERKKIQKYLSKLSSTAAINCSLYEETETSADTRLSGGRRELDQM
jgi:hypothetical protein